MASCESSPNIQAAKEQFNLYKTPHRTPSELRTFAATLEVTHNVPSKEILPPSPLQRVFEVFRAKRNK